MAKPKECSQIAGRNIWDYEIDILTAAFPDQSLKWAHTWVTMRWMHLGDLRPLAAAIRLGIIRAMLDLLAEMIEEGRITVTKRGRGSKLQPDTAMRQFIAARFYKHLVAKKLESPKEARRLAAGIISRDVGTVRKAVTLLRSLER